MNNSSDEFQLMLNQIDMSSQIVEYQDFISGKFSLKQAESALIDLVGNFNAFADFIKSTKPEEVFDVSVKEKVKDLYESGKIGFKMLTDDSGFAPILFANEEIKIGNKTYLKNKTVSQVRLNKRDITPNMANAINNYVVNKKLSEINAKLDEINENIGDVEQGQRNDRIALVYSAEEKMKEAIATDDEALKRFLIANAISTANDARFQLMETLKTDMGKFISKLPRKKAQGLVEKGLNVIDWIKVSANSIAKIIEQIRSAFFYINMATGICAQGYMLLDEKQPMQKSINVYKDFISDMFIENNDIISSLQSYDKKSDNMWLEKPKEIYETLDNFSIKCADNLNLLDSNNNDNEYIEQNDNYENLREA